MEEELSSEAGRKALPDFSIKKSMCEARRERRGEERRGEEMRGEERRGEERRGEEKICCV